jgi:prevent-host-death family protein
MNEHEISLTELRKRLGLYLSYVEDGMTIRITKRGKVIGRIIPEGKYLKERMVDLVKQGVIHWGGKPLNPWNSLVRNKGPVLLSDLVYDERRRI